MIVKLNSIDFELRKFGLIRKHMPRDPSSFFRCFADCYLLSQHQHVRIREKLLQFTRSESKWSQHASDLSDRNKGADSGIVLLAAHCFRVPVVVFRDQESHLISTIYDPFCGSEAEPDDQAECDTAPIALVACRGEDGDNYDLVLTEYQMQVAAMTQGKHVCSVSAATDCIRCSRSTGV